MQAAAEAKALSTLCCPANCKLISIEPSDVTNVNVVINELSRIVVLIDFAVMSAVFFNPNESIFLFPATDFQ